MPALFVLNDEGYPEEVFDEDEWNQYFDDGKDKHIIQMDLYESSLVGDVVHALIFLGWDRSDGESEKPVLWEVYTTHAGKETCKYYNTKAHAVHNFDQKNAALRDIYEAWDKRMKAANVRFVVNLLLTAVVAFALCTTVAFFPDGPWKVPLGVTALGSAFLSYRLFACSDNLRKNVAKAKLQLMETT